MIPQPITVQQLKKPNAWQIELKNAFEHPIALLNYLEIKQTDQGLLFPDYDLSQPFKTRVPRPFAELMAPKSPLDPLLLQVLPLKAENITVPGFDHDPLKENNPKTNPIPGLLHKFSSRVLFTLTGACAVHCRYCFRRHFPYHENTPGLKNLEPIINYIKKHPDINEIILSGGDPLSANDAYLTLVFEKIKTLTQIKIIRFHTRFPIVIPQRITPELAQLFKGASEAGLKIVIVFHCNHPNELSPELALRLSLIKPFVTLLNQSVLLKKINDTPDVLISLSEKLFQWGILPYYLHQLDRVTGAHHFEVALPEAKKMVRALYQHLPGYLVPRFVQEVPGLDSKYPISCFD
jgi:EF-P beta-lysylation protein EpmB